MKATAKESKTQAASNRAARRKRVKRLKKMIVGFILAAIVIPVVVCVLLTIRIFSLKEQLREAETTRDTLMEAMADGRFFFGEEETPNEAEEETLPTEEGATEDTQTRKVYLTFDDGPSANTPEILKILEEYNVKATFFVTGEEAKSHPEYYQAIVDGGHTLGMHSFSHRYNEIYTSEDEFGRDLSQLQEFLEETTQITPQFYRFPGGSSNTVSELPMTVFCDYLTDNGITYFDWNVSSKDAASPMRSKEEIVRNCTDDLERFEHAVILLHDAVNKASTVEALPEVIEKIQAMENTEILPITEKTVVIHH